MSEDIETKQVNEINYFFVIDIEKAENGFIIRYKSRRHRFPEDEGKTPAQFIANTKDELEMKIHDACHVFQNFIMQKTFSDPFEKK